MKDRLFTSSFAAGTCDARKKMKGKTKSYFFTLCMLGNFSCFLLTSLTFFKNTYQQMKKIASSMVRVKPNISLLGVDE